MKYKYHAFTNIVISTFIFILNLKLHAFHKVFNKIRTKIEPLGVNKDDYKHRKNSRIIR